MKALLFAPVAMLLAAPAVAQTQAQMNADARAAYTRADAAMTAQWKRTYAYMKGRDAAGGNAGFRYAASTLASQRAWLSFRDAQCTIEAGEFAGGTMAPLARAQCLTRLTKERSAQLTNIRWRQ